MTVDKKLIKNIMDLKLTSNLNNTILVGAKVLIDKALREGKLVSYVDNWTNRVVFKMEVPENKILVNRDSINDMLHDILIITVDIDYSLLREFSKKYIVVEDFAEFACGYNKYTLENELELLEAIYNFFRIKK